MNWWAKTILVLGLATLASGCSGGSPKPTPTATSSASETATTALPTAEPTRVLPTVDPKAPTGGPPPANYPPPRPKPSAADQATLATDPLVVYADEVGSTSFNGRSWPVVEVVSYNLRTDRTAGLFRVGEVGEFAYPAQVMLAGRKVVMNLEKRLVVANLDGSGMRTLFAVPAGAVVTTFAVSPDGKTVALGTEATDLRDESLSSLVFVDLTTGKELRRISQGAFTAVGMGGSPGVRQWTPDGNSVRLSGVVHKDADPNAPGAIAGLDGSVSRSLAGRERPGVAERFSTSRDFSDRRMSCGFGIAYRKFSITDAATGRVIANVAPEGRVASADQWSRDGSTLLFSTLKVVPSAGSFGGECFEEGPPAWHTWSLGGIKDVPDLRALLQQWDGPRFIDLICNGAPIVMDYPLNAGYLICGNPANTPPATLVIGGKPIGQIHQAAVVGFID